MIKNSKLLAALTSAILMCIPIFLGTTAYFNPDYVLVLLFIYMAYCDYKGYGILCFWNAVILSHAKETEMQIVDEELSNMQNKLKRKEDDMLILEDKIKQYENNLKDFEKNKKNILEIKAENDKINNNNKKLNETIINLEKNLEFYKNKFNDISSKYDILRKDKESINRETIIQKDKNKELNIENENIKNEIKLLNEEKAQLIKKIKDYDMIKKRNLMI